MQRKNFLKSLATLIAAPSLIGKIESKPIDAPKFIGGITAYIPVDSEKCYKDFGLFIPKNSFYTQNEYTMAEWLKIQNQTWFEYYDAEVEITKK